MSRQKGKDDTTGDFLADFRQLGFTEYEAKVYMQLLAQAPATAYEIAKATGVPRPNTYNALESLTKRGAVQPISQNPAKYVASPPDRHLLNLGRQTMALCDSLSKELAKLRVDQDDPYVWNVQGDLAIHRKIQSLISESQRTIRIKADEEILRPHAEALREAAARGIDILIILFGKDVEAFRFSPNCRVYLHEGNGVRMGSADNLFTLTVDHQIALTATTDNMTAFYTRNYAVVQMADTLIRHDYYMARIHMRFGELIDNEFGPHLQELRMSSFSPEQVRTFLERTGLGEPDLPDRKSSRTP